MVFVSKEAKEKGSTYTDEINISYLMDMGKLHSWMPILLPMTLMKMPWIFHLNKDMDENPIFLDGTLLNLPTLKKEKVFLLILQT